MNLQIGERRGLRAALLALLAAAVVLSSGILGAQAPEKKADAEPPAAPAANQPAAYVGSQTCQPCHEDIYNAFQKNPHIAVETDKKRGWEAKACEMCHGPGSKHAESASATDIRNA